MTFTLWNFFRDFFTFKLWGEFIYEWPEREVSGVSLGVWVWRRNSSFRPTTITPPSPSPTQGVPGESSVWFCRRRRGRREVGTRDRERRGEGDEI